MERVSVFVYRLEKFRLHVGVTIAAAKREPVLDAKSLLAQIRKGVTAWMNETEEGKKAYDDSCADFNAGDLAQWIETGKRYEDDRQTVYESDSLAAYLERAGVIDLEVVGVPDDNADWTYDTLLFNKGEVQEDDDEDD